VFVVGREAAGRRQRRVVRSDGFQSFIAIPCARIEESGCVARRCGVFRRVARAPGQVPDLSRNVGAGRWGGRGRGWGGRGLRGWGRSGLRG
jgi:hypothetical protein